MVTKTAIIVGNAEIVNKYNLKNRKSLQGHYCLAWSSVWKGIGRDEIPMVHSDVGGSSYPAETLIWNFCIILAKNKKISIRANDSPTQARFPRERKLR